MYLCFDLLKSLWGEIAFRLGFTTGVSEWLLRPKRPKNIHGTKNKLRAQTFQKHLCIKKIKVQLASYQSNGSKGVNVAPTPFQDGI